MRGGEGYRGRQDLSYSVGVSAESAGARGLCLHTLVIPPGGRAKAHLHEDHESAIYVISGEAEMWWGEGLAHHMVASAGDFVYIPAGVPHLPANTHPTEPAIGVVARTDPAEQESVVLLPELDHVPDQLR
ncbi:MAG: Cupin 2 conserved barrel domain protein [Pseudonocardiales bacterium]|nr:Cupin 2 conserved barrel domain protein [Pseudonocardiales bacterium]